ncbi:guanine deaminase [Psychrobacter sp. DAB_AL62B]|uniref:guanine deaminase n=1 Tax=Psychrobacter sp. DAB_AL62B TaxID=1028420 RepID=UPI00238105D2|nr:guanine deaminase [Psychrobacter sp. DAB_AL62B]MDE4453789.1 guanine deaminase [Psychrobacter sp. DAB_AL62B]
MTIHIYQAQLLHYLTEENLAERMQCTNSDTTDLTNAERRDLTVVNKNITLLPVIAGVKVYPEYIANGALVVDDVTGRVVDYGNCTSIMSQYGKASRQENKAPVQIHDYQDKLIMPGFIDTHVHYPQIDMIAAFGEQLLDWLNNYTFVTEANFGDAKIADDTAKFFLNQLLANGTTSALVFSTSHPQSVESFFNESTRLNTRMITGNVLMDQNAPEHLCVPTEQGIRDTQNIIDKWHERGRQHVAITPRFAITSTPKQLQMTGELYRSYDSVYLQTHLAENLDEIAFVRELYPNHKGYLDVYHDLGLLGRRTTLAHGIYLETPEYEVLRDTGTQIAHCPTSNLFLGSGLFDLSKTLSYTGVSIATDVGAGTSLSMLTTLSEAYKVQQLQKNPLSAHQGLYQITLGNAQSLLLDNKIGNFMPNKEADFVVIDMSGTDLMERRMTQTKSLDEQLFVLMMLGDDRVIEETIIAGVSRYKKTATV